MGRHTKRHIDQMTLDRMLGKVGECRQAAIDVITKAPIYGDHYKAAGRLKDALDDMAGHLTGDRGFFGLKDAQSHNAPSGPIGAVPAPEPDRPS